ISSITFRTGVIDARNNVTIHAPTRYVTNPRPIPSASYEKALFERKLAELGLNADFCHRVLDSLPGQFTLAALRASLADAQKQARGRDAGTVGAILALAHSNYEVQFTKEQPLAERVIFPHSPSQSNGIEDARFVRLRDDDGARAYYATYTAYDGRVTFPQLLATKDFLRFKFSTLNGPAVQNKGMALFPRKIRGLYAMLSRQDNENIHLMYSENLHFWYESRTILKPARPWEFVQLGNCGSPIETDAGWLVLSHGVGPMRHYCIGAFLLDRADPAKVIGRLREPLITPNHAEREGYVPNVVYSCGALLHGRTLVIPYAMSDSASSFATASLDNILAAME
ncbi:MAG: glycoside hydrolase family 130 protein, partial [Acetobacteraceae bacterium]